MTKEVTIVKLRYPILPTDVGKLAVNVIQDEATKQIFYEVGYLIEGDAPDNKTAVKQLKDTFSAVFAKALLVQIHRESQSETLTDAGGSGSVRWTDDVIEGEDRV